MAAAPLRRRVRKVITGTVCVAAGFGVAAAEEPAPLKTPRSAESLIDFVTGLPVSRNVRDIFKPRLMRSRFANAPAGSLKKLASDIKFDQLDAKERQEAVEYLATVDPAAYPNAHRLLVESLISDRSETVRHAAAKALSAQFNHKGHKTAARSIRSNYVREEGLADIAGRAFIKDQDGHYLEPSLRVRRSIVQALDSYNPAIQWQTMAQQKAQTIEGMEELFAENPATKGDNLKQDVAPLIISDIVPISASDKDQAEVSTAAEKKQEPSQVELLPAPPKPQPAVKVAAPVLPSIDLPMPEVRKPKNEVKLDVVEFTPPPPIAKVEEDSQLPVIDDLSKSTDASAEKAEPAVVDSPAVANKKDEVAVDATVTDVAPAKPQAPKKKSGGIFGLNRLIKKLRGSDADDVEVSQNTTRQPTPLEEQELSPELRELIKNVSVKRIQPKTTVQSTGLPRTDLTDSIQDPVVERSTKELPSKQEIVSAKSKVEVPIIEEVVVEAPPIEPKEATVLAEELPLVPTPAVEAVDKDTLVPVEEPIVKRQKPAPIQPEPAVVKAASIQLPMPTPSNEVEEEIELTVVEPQLPKPVAEAPVVAAPVVETVQEEVTPDPVQEPTIAPSDFPLAECYRGYCPVGMAKRKLNKSDSAFAAVYKGQRFEFEGPEALAEFNAAPEKFAPVMGGIDVVTWTQKQEKRTGYYVVDYKGSYYWFATLANVKVFYDNPARFVSEVN